MHYMTLQRNEDPLSRGIPYLNLCCSIVAPEHSLPKPWLILLPLLECYQRRNICSTKAFIYKGLELETPTTLASPTWLAYHGS